MFLAWLLTSNFRPESVVTRVARRHIVLLDMKEFICHFTKWQIHPFISKREEYTGTAETCYLFSHFHRIDTLLRNNYFPVSILLFPCSSSDFVTNDILSNLSFSWMTFCRLTFPWFRHFCFLTRLAMTFLTSGIFNNNSSPCDIIIKDIFVLWHFYHCLFCRLVCLPMEYIYPPSKNVFSSS